MERERVGIVASYPLIPDTPDGVKDFILGLQKILVQKGIDAFLVGPSLPKESPNMADETLGISLIPVKIGKTGYKGTVTLNLPRATKMLNRRTPDVLDIEEPWASPPNFITVLMATNFVSKKPAVVAQFHSYTENLTAVQKSLIIAGKTSRILKEAMKKVHERSAVSPDTARLWARINKEDVCSYEIIPNGIDIDKFTKERGQFRNWQTLKEKGYKILLATARHDKRKGFDFLIKAVGEIIKNGERKNILLKLTGRGPETENLKRLVNALGLSEYIEFLGNLSEEDLIKAVKNCDMLVAPSIGDEGTNRSILNGRAAEKLVAATEIGGQTFAYGDPDIFGEMAKPSNVDSLAKVINDFLKLPKEEADRRTSQGFIDVQRFSWETVGEQKIRQYDRAIERNKNKLAASE